MHVKSTVCSALFCLSLLPLTAQAQEETPFDRQDEFAPSVEHNEAFDVARDELANVVQNMRPTCDTPQLREKILATVEDYLQTQASATIVHKRHNALLLRDLQAFEEIPAAGFSPDTDVTTANALITLRINRKIRSEEILLCRQSNAQKRPVYVVLYPFAGRFSGYIINLEKNVSDFDRVTFEYP
jgi:hypothetical protein